MEIVVLDLRKWLEQALNIQIFSIKVTFKDGITGLEDTRSLSFLCDQVRIKEEGPKNA